MIYCINDGWYHCKYAEEDEDWLLQSNNDSHNDSIQIFIVCSLNIVLFMNRIENGRGKVEL